MRPASRAPRAAPTTGERPYHLGNLRRTLLEEGWAATIESGAKDVSLREIARRAGVSPTASFHHFRNKEALLVAVAVEGFARLTATLRKRLESVDDPTERLRIVLRTYIEFAIEHPAVFFRMFGPLLSTPNKYPDLRTTALTSFESFDQPSLSALEAIPAISTVPGTHGPHGLRCTALQACLLPGLDPARTNAFPEPHS